ncbi:MAG: aldo/keto reductase family protein [Myxococcales bacterium]|nr:aldo/keto reductase family protein [Myxococcales bacterium]
MPRALSNPPVAMQYRQLGRSGLRVSALSIGGWLTLGGSVDRDGSVRILGAALEAGVNFVDMADVYARGEAERVVDALLRERAHRGQRRAHLVLSTKVFWPMSDDPNDRGLSRKHIHESIDASLRRMGTDYVDLYFCHRFDPQTPLEETVRAMDDLVRAGKVLYWGTSCWTADQLHAAHAICDAGGYHRPTVEQPQYSLLHRDIEHDGVRDAAVALGMGLVLWSPLAQGVLTGKYDAGIPAGSRGESTHWVSGYLSDRNIERVRQLGALAAERGVATSALALAWLLHQPGVTSAIMGATTTEQLAQNLGADAIALDDATTAAISALFAP